MWLGRRRRAARVASAGPLPEGPTDPPAVVDAARGGRGSRARCDPGRPLLRVRDRRRRAGRRRRGLADERLGSERGPVRRRARRRRWSRRSPARGSPSCSGYPAGVSFGFVTGCQMAHFTALAAARHEVLERVGWDVNERGLIGAPPCTWSRATSGTRPSTARSASSASAPPASSRSRPTTRAACCPTRCARRCSELRGPDDRLRVGRQREHRLDRPARRRSPTRPRRPARGCTSTAPSASGPPRARGSATSSPAPSAPTRGRPTRTSGSTSPTTAASRSARTPRRTARRWACARAT